MPITLGHWRDEVGGQIPSTSWAGFEVAEEQSNDAGSNLTQPNDSTIQVGEALTHAGGKAKMFVATLKYQDTSNGRSTPRGRFVLSSGTGDLFTTYDSGYVRNSSNDVCWIRVIGVLFDSSLNAQVQLQHRSDTNLLSGGSVVNASDLQVFDLHYDNAGLYTDGTGGVAFSGTTFSDVSFGTTDFETDTASIERTSATSVTLKTASKRYIILGSMSGTGGGTRTSRDVAFSYGGTTQDDTTQYIYQRSAANDTAGCALVDLYELPSGSVSVQMRCRTGTALDGEGGAENAGTWTSNAGEVQMCVIELPSTAEVFRSHDSTGGQEVSAGATLNSMRDVDFNDSASYTGTSNTVMTVEADHNMLAFGNAWAARSAISNTRRSTTGGRIDINGTNQTIGESGVYSRGAQSTTGTFSWSLLAGAVYPVLGTETVSFETFQEGQSSGVDETNASTVSFLAVNLDSLVPAPASTTMVADTASYVLIGNNVSLIEELSMSAETGDFSMTPQEANLIETHIMSCATVAFVMTGNDAGIAANYLMSADTTTFTLTGEDIATSRDYVIKPVTGTYTLSSLGAALFKTGAGGNTVMAGAVGVFNLSGVTTNLITDHTLVANASSYTLAGNSVDLKIVRTILTESGSFNFVASDATFGVSIIMLAETGTFTMSGVNIVTRESSFFAEEYQSFSPSNLITLYEIDSTALGGTYGRFTSSADTSGAIEFGGNTYTPLPVEADGFELTAQGTLPTPTLKILNTASLQSAVISLDDLLGSTFYRIRTFRTFLDNGDTPDPTATFPVDIYKIERKARQNKVFIEFELSSSIDQEGKKLPGRQIIRDYCTHTYRVYNAESGTFDYTKATCPYAGTEYYDTEGNPTNSAGDKCGKRLSSCKLRFGENAELPTRAFPGVARTR